jgi:hypothetical protein
LRLFCSGDYFTTLDPVRNSKTDILQNNYGSLANNDNKRNKADAYVAVDLPNNKVKKVENISRDIYVFKGDVKLGEHPHHIAKNPKRK